MTNKSNAIKPDAHMTDDEYKFDKKKECKICGGIDGRHKQVPDPMAGKSNMLTLMQCPNDKVVGEQIAEQAAELKAKDEDLKKQSGIIYARDIQVGRLKDKIKELLEDVAQFNAGWEAAQKGQPFSDEETDYCWQEGWQIFDYGRLVKQLEAKNTFIDRQTEQVNAKDKALQHIKNVLSAAIARPTEIAIDWKEFLVKFVEQALKGRD